jgi:hypothetical protein
LIPLLRIDAGLRRIAIGLTISLLCSFALVELDPWYARFVLFFPVLPALALARMWERHRFVAVLGSLALALGFLATCLPLLLPREALLNLAREDWQDRASNPPPTVPMDDAPIGYLCEDFGAGYCLYGPDYSHQVVYLRDETLDALLAHLERERIGILYVDGALKKRSAMLEEGIRRGLLQPLAQSGWRGYFVRVGR